MKKILMIMMVLSLLLVGVVGADFNPREDIIGKDTYSIKGFVYVNATSFYQDGSLLLDVDDVNDTTFNYSSYANKSFYWDSLNTPSDILISDLTQTGEGDLNVNSSDYWDSLNTESDLTPSNFLTAGNYISYTGDTLNVANQDILDDSVINASQVQNFDIGGPSNYYYANIVNMSDESITYVDGRSYYAELGGDSQVTISGENVTSGIVDSSYIDQSLSVNNLTTNNINISQFSTGYDVIISKMPNNNLIAINQNGNLIAGGENGINLDNPKDFGEILEYSVNSLNAEGDTHIAIFVSALKNVSNRYIANTTATLNTTIGLFGPGKNQANIGTESGLANKTLINFDASNPSLGNEYIFRISDIKFESNNKSAPSEYVKGYINLTGISEIIVTNTEFRDAQDYGLKASDSAGWNYITNNWFLAGADLEVNDTSDLIMIGNKFHTANISLSYTDNFVRRGNYLASGANWNLTNVSFATPSEEFGNLTAGRVGIGTSNPTAKLDVTGGDIHLHDNWPVIRLQSNISGDGAIGYLNSSGDSRAVINMNDDDIDTHVSNGSHLIKVTRARSDGFTHYRKVKIEDNGTGYGLRVNQNGETEAVEINSEAPSSTVLNMEAVTRNYGVKLNNNRNGTKTVKTYLASGVSGSGSNFFGRYLNSSVTEGPVIRIKQDNVDDDQPAISVQNDGTGEGLFIDQNGNGDALNIDNAGTHDSISITQNGNTCNINVDADDTCDSGTKIGEDNSIALCLSCS